MELCNLLQSDSRQCSSALAQQASRAVLVCRFQHFFHSTSKLSSVVTVYAVPITQYTIGTLEVSFPCEAQSHLSDFLQN